MSDKEKKDKDKKGEKSKFGFDFSFNFYWVYVLIAVAFVAMVFMPSMDQEDRKLNDDQLKQMLASGDVEELVIVNKEIAEIFVREEALESNEAYSKVKDSPFGGLNKGPHFFYQIVEIQNFDNTLKTVKNDLPADKRFTTDAKTRQNWGDSVMWLLPFVLIIGV